MGKSRGEEHAFLLPCISVPSKVPGHAFLFTYFSVPSNWHISNISQDEMIKLHELKRDYLNWTENSASNTKVRGLIPIWVIH